MGWFRKRPQPKQWHIDEAAVGVGLPVELSHPGEIVGESKRSTPTSRCTGGRSRYSLQARRKRPRSTPSISRSGLMMPVSALPLSIGLKSATR